MRTNHVPAVDTNTAGHLPYAVQTAAAAESADRHIARNYPHVAELLADVGAREHPEDEGILLDLVKVIAATPNAVHTAMQKAVPDKYTVELASQLAADLIAQFNVMRQPAACPVYRDCIETGPHYDHSGHDLLKVMDETGRESLLDAGMIGLSSDDPRATVYIRNAEFTDAASVRQKTAELRSFLDQVDALADRVFTDHQARA
ncbi:hypothetical protein [Streptomyces sp. NBC_00620]|uniref:hypothetical protein n=1 Tax=Streptomyces sp. NBC_00620 TaxID=2903666 RepID=UPI00224EF23B|nr:hypothetical protein [Streptomyces sp. NBC_00620]MCX4973168.1 hypothetical protein [Streptomyces sp. NBC_00620]